MDTLAVEDFEATNDASVGTPKGKPQKRQLLKSLVGGTAAFGLLFLFLHFRFESIWISYCCEVFIFFTKRSLNLVSSLMS